MKVVCVFFGQAGYVVHALNTAAHFGNDVHLIGDCRQLRGNFKFYHVDRYSHAIEEFKKVFKPNGPHDPEFRFRSSVRWFLFREFSKEHGPIMTIDGDVMLFENVESIIDRVPDGTDFTHSRNNVCSTIGESLWFDTEALCGLCRATIAMYSQGNFSRKTHYSDMRAATRLVDSGKYNSFNTYNEFEHGRLDHNNLSSENGRYKMESDGRVKLHAWKDGLPYAYDKKEDRFVRFASIHCSGSKHRVRRYHDYARDKFSTRGKDGRCVVQNNSGNSFEGGPRDNT